MYSLPFLLLGARYFSDPIADAEEEKQETVDAFFASATAPMAFGDERRHMYAQRKKQTQLLPVTTTGSEITSSEIDILQLDKTAEHTTNAKNVTLSMLNNW